MHAHVHVGSNKRIRSRTLAALSLSRCYGPSSLTVTTLDTCRSNTSGEMVTEIDMRACAEMGVGVDVDVRMGMDTVMAMAMEMGAPCVP